MGEVAGRNSDLVIATSDNPRTENPLQILAEIEAGLKNTNCPYQIISDRREAIFQAISKAKPNDVVIIAEKVTNVRAVNAVVRFRQIHPDQADGIVRSGRDSRIFPAAFAEQFGLVIPPRISCNRIYLVFARRRRVVFRAERRRIMNDDLTL